MSVARFPPVYKTHGSHPVTGGLLWFTSIWDNAGVAGAIDPNRYARSVSEILGSIEKPRNKRLAPLGFWAGIGSGSDDNKTKLAESIDASDFLLFIRYTRMCAQDQHAIEPMQGVRTSRVHR